MIRGNCHECNKLRPLLYLPDGMVKGTMIKKYRGLCGECQNKTK